MENRFFMFSHSTQNLVGIASISHLSLISSHVTSLIWQIRLNRWRWFFTRSSGNWLIRLIFWDAATASHSSKHSSTNSERSVQSSRTVLRHGKWVGAIKTWFSRFASTNRSGFTILSSIDRWGLSRSSRICICPLHTMAARRKLIRNDLIRARRPTFGNGDNSSKHLENGIVQLIGTPENMNIT
jgi:hypothetical protein